MRGFAGQWLPSYAPVIDECPCVAAERTSSSSLLMTTSEFARADRESNGRSRLESSLTTGAAPPELCQTTRMLRFMATRAESDEHYILDLCDEVIGAKCSRQHRFEWLLGDASPVTARRVALPVDGYWEAERLVVEFAESQHEEPTPHFDKPDVMTVSGVHCGIQRAIYDDRRRVVIPEHGLRLVIIAATNFRLKGKRIDRDRNRDLAIVSAILEREGFGHEPLHGGTSKARIDEHNRRPVRIVLRQFVADREWDKFHTPENLAKSISIEAGELLECFQWDGSADPSRIAEELADVLTYCLLLADKLDVDADQIVLDKLEVTRSKYPVDRSRGRSTKYDQL